LTEINSAPNTGGTSKIMAHIKIIICFMAH
jgi:hypothetical protein